MRTQTAICGFLALLALLSAPVKAQTNATNILAALQAANLTGLVSLIRLAGLETALSNPNLTATLFAPTNAAIADATAALAASKINTTLVAPIILQYHLVPNASIAFKDGLILQTALSSQNISNTTRTLDVISTGNGSWYLGGIIPGASFNISSKIKAGKSDIYIVDTVLVPPSGLFGIPLTLAQWAKVTPGYSILSSLIGNDTVVLNATSNPNLAVTLFAPNDTAFNTLFKGNNVTLAQVAGTSTARRILLNHIYPAFPLISSDIPVGNSTVPSASANDTILISKSAGANATITVRGGGNSAPIPVLQANIPAGMSGIFQIAAVILPSQNTTSTNTTARTPTGK